MQAVGNERMTSVFDLKGMTDREDSLTRYSRLEQNKR